MTHSPRAVTREAFDAFMKSRNQITISQLQAHALEVADEHGEDGEDFGYCVSDMIEMGQIGDNTNIVDKEAVEEYLTSNGY